MEFMQLVFSKWWISLILFICFVLFLEWLRYLIALTMRHRTLRKLGYPPKHVNADGLFYTKEE